MSLIPEHVATLIHQIDGQAVTIEVFGLSELIAIPAKSGGQYISRFCNCRIKDGPLDDICVGMHRSHQMKPGSDIEQKLKDWMPRRSHAIAIEAACGRIDQDLAQPLFAIVNLDSHPYGQDLQSFRKRCRYDALRAISNHLDSYAASPWMTLEDVKASGLLTRIYADEELAAAMRYWNLGGIFREAVLGPKYLLDDVHDEKICELIREYDWEEKPVGSVADVKAISSEEHLAEILKCGEDQLHEFKASGTEPRKLSKEIAAMLNTSRGGIIWYGVADDGTVQGTDKKLQDLDQAVQNSIRNTIAPAATISLSLIEAAGKQIICMIVPPWDGKTVYQYEGRILIRRGTSVFRTSPDEARRLYEGKAIV